MKAICQDTTELPLTWAEYRWPRFVPAKVREEIQNFWSEKHGRNPKQWHAGTVADPYNQHPSIGQKITVKLSLYPKAPKRTGRWVPAWNGIGRLISRGSIFVVSVCDISTRHPSTL